MKSYRFVIYLFNSKVKSFVHSSTAKEFIYYIGTNFVIISLSVDKAFIR